MIYWFYSAPIIEIKIFDVSPWKKNPKFRKLSDGKLKLNGPFKDHPLVLAVSQPASIRVKIHQIIETINFHNIVYLIVKLIII